MAAACPEVACHEETPEMAEQTAITPVKSRTSAVTRSTVGTEDVESAADGTRVEAAGAPSAVRTIFESQATSFLASHLPNPTRPTPAPNMTRPLKAGSQCPPCMLIA